MYRPSLREPKAKKSFSSLKQPFPIPIESISKVPASNSSWRWYHGLLINSKVIVEKDRNSEHLWHMGYFGDGGEEDRKKKRAKDENFLFVHVREETPSLDSESNETKDGSSFNFHNSYNNSIHLDLIEAFFLSYALGCLIVEDEITGLKYNVDQLWEKCLLLDSNFHERYAVYHHFRIKGWVVKNGTKYGVDFVLYKNGPPFYHASYSVLLRSSVINWTSLMGLNRVTESTVKELLIIEIENQNSNSYFSSPTDYLSSISITEVLLKRWIPSQERH